MDDHFNRILAPVASSASSADIVRFIPADSFQGSKVGYYFTKGSKGLGYYYDPVQKDAFMASNKDSKKRNLNEISESEADFAPSKRRAEASAVEKIVEETDLSNITPLDANSLRQLVSNFEKKIKKNQMMRAKYPDEPEKFMESEIEVHDHIQELYSIAAYPELYPLFLHLGALPLVLGMLIHENTDISIACIGLLQEMTEKDDDNEDSESDEHYQALSSSLVSQQGMELLVQNMSRLDEKNEEDAQGVFNTLSILENVLDVDPSVADKLVKDTQILDFLMNRLNAKQFDANKQFCSEILSILFQSSLEAQRKLVASKFGDCDGLEFLLQAAAQYRKKDPETAEETEMVNDIFLCISTLVALDNDIKVRFLELEGMELMVRCLKDKFHSAWRAVKVIQFCVDRNVLACQKLVDVGGLKFLFPLLMGKSLPSTLAKKKSSHSDRTDLDESIVHIIAQLCIMLKFSDNQDHLLRVFAKFLENDYEKIHRCSELFVKYSKKLSVLDQEIEKKRIAFERGEDDSLEDLLDEDNIRSQRLEGGLAALIDLSIILSSVITSVTSDALKQMILKLDVDKMTPSDVLVIFHEYMEELSAGLDQSSEGDKEKGVVSDDMHFKALVGIHDKFVDMIGE